MTYDKIRDNLLRRMAVRQGLTLRRSRRRDPRATDYGLYWLTETATGKPRSPGHGVTMEQIEMILTADTGPATVEQFYQFLSKNLTS